MTHVCVMSHVTHVNDSSHTSHTHTSMSVNDAFIYMTKHTTCVSESCHTCVTMSQMSASLVNCVTLLRESSHVTQRNRVSRVTSRNVTSHRWATIEREWQQAARDVGLAQDARAAEELWRRAAALAPADGSEEAAWHLAQRLCVRGIREQVCVVCAVGVWNRCVEYIGCQKVVSFLLHGVVCAFLTPCTPGTLRGACVCEASASRCVQCVEQVCGADVWM